MTSVSAEEYCAGRCGRSDCDGCCPSDAPSGRAYEHLNCLVATAEGEWWECDCGRPLDEPAAPGTVTCACGQQWRFGYWPLPGHPDGGETTGLEPRRV